MRYNTIEPMKNVIVAILVVIILAGAGYYFLQQSNSQQGGATVTPTPTQNTQVTTTPTSTASAFCTPSQITATMNTEVAAGNAYVQLTIKNTSQNECQVVGNNMPEVGYPVSVENFQTVTKRPATTPIFTLAPDQTIYSLIHYPNGPQCSSMATGVDAMVSYAVSEDDTVTFQPTRGTTLSIPSCGDDSDITTIDLYAFSTEEVTP